MFVTLRDGLSSLVEAIAARLPPGAVRLNTPVGRIERQGEGWRVETGGNEECGMMNDECTADVAILGANHRLILHPSSFIIHHSTP